MISVCIPTYNRFDLLEQAVQKYKDQGVKDIYVMDNSPNHACPLIKDVHIIRSDRNIISYSWNYFFEYIHGDLLIANDDVLIEDNAIYELEKAIKSSQHALLYGNTRVATAFSWFHLRRNVYEQVGKFDEEFKPGYFEDCDYSYRMSLLGHDLYCVEDARFNHVGSATIKMFTPAQELQREIAFRRCQMRYSAKWGGLPGHERYTTEFNR